MRPLSGARVLDVTGTTAGEMATKHLADLGALVIRPQSSRRDAHSEARNRGKSVTGATPARLLAQEDFDVAVSDDPRLDRVPLQKSPGHLLVEIVATSRSGGPLTAPSYGLSAMGGLTGICGDEQPMTPEPAQAAQLVGLHAAIAAAAWLAGSRTARHIEIVGDECVSACLESALPFYFCDRRVVRWAPNLHDVAWPTSAYATSDGWVGITAGRFDDARHLLDLLQLDDVLPASASSFEEIIPSAAVLNATLASALRRWPTAKLVTSCQEAGLAVAPALWPADLLTDEQLLARGLVAEGSRRLTRFPALFCGEPAGPARPARRALRADGVTVQRAAKESVRPLTGIRVVDLTWALAGPIATMVLADLGADVVKLESRNHVDSSRLVGPYNGPHDIDHSGYHRFFNRGKRSIECDFRAERSRAMLLELVALSDVVVENFRAGSLDAKGLGYDALLRHRQGLVMCSLSGFGRTGPRASWRSYGAGMAEAHSGLAAAMGGERPIVPGRSYADFIAGLYAALCICAQLYHRRVRCKGSYSDVAQFDTCAATVLDLAVLGPEPAEAHHIEPGAHGSWAAVGDTGSFLVEDIGNVARRGLASGFLAPFRRAEGEVDVYARFPGLLDGERLEITRPSPFLGESSGPGVLESWAESAESAT